MTNPSDLRWPPEPPESLKRKAADFERTRYVRDTAIHNILRAHPELRPEIEAEYLRLIQNKQEIDQVHKHIRDIHAMQQEIIEFAPNPPYIGRNPYKP